MRIVHYTSNQWRCMSHDAKLLFEWIVDWFPNIRLKSSTGIMYSKGLLLWWNFWSSRELGFLGDEMLASQNNGNYLGCLELISEFDSFLADHIQNYGNRWKGSTSYLSVNICNEFINIIGEKVLTMIISEIKAAKYYSISIDSTPDLCHVDQLTFIVRFVKDGKPIKRFLQFFLIKEHKV